MLIISHVNYIYILVNICKSRKCFAGASFTWKEACTTGRGAPARLLTTGRRAGVPRCHIIISPPDGCMVTFTVPLPPTFSCFTWASGSCPSAAFRSV